MGGRGGSMGGSHGMGGGGGAAKAAQPQTREQQLLAQIRNDPTALMRMSDQDAADAVAEIEKQPIASDGTQRDCFIQRYMALIGWDTRKPELLDDADYENARKKAGEASMYHADKNCGGTTGDVYNRQLQSGGTMYYSEGVHGAGTYWAHYDAAGSSQYGSYQVKAFLNKKAKAVTTYDLAFDRAQLRHSKPKLFAALQNAKRGKYGGDSESLNPILAAAKGCNVIVNRRGSHSAKPFQGTYVVTLDRSVLTMSSKSITDANKYMVNW